MDSAQPPIKKDEAVYDVLYLRKVNLPLQVEEGIEPFADRFSLHS